MTHELSLVRCRYAFRNSIARDDGTPYPHTHPCTELVFLGKVTGWLHEAGRKWRYAPGQVAVYQPGPDHWAIDDTGSRGHHTCM